MRVLVVAYAYPPFPMVGAIRPAKLVKRLLKEGHEVHVLTGRLPGEKPRFREKEPGFSVEVVPTWPNPKHLYRWLKRKRNRGSDDEDAAPAPSVASIERWAVPERISLLKRLVLSGLQTPDDLQGFIVPATVRGLKAFPRGPDLVFSTSPPPSSHLVGLLIKAIAGARWAAEFRDPWSSNEASEAGGRIRSRPTDALNGWLERLCLRSSDHIVTVTRRAAEIIGGRLAPENRRKIILARSGIDTLRLARDPSNLGPFTVVYLGGIGGGRDPRTFLKAVAELVRSRELGTADLAVELVGNCRFYHDLGLEEEIERLGISKFFRFRDWVDHEEAQKVLSGADLFLLLAQKQRAQVPNKLYEYLGAGRPILAFVDDDGESAELLRRTGGHYLVTDGDDRVALRALGDALDSFQEGDGYNGSPPSPALLRRWSTERQYDHLLEALRLA
ncbi:MAG: glycosyltransferase family 4 protein [Gemmatimonadetes bacterium]|nr:glycosyltransferase family 4 protein [Gemmatimonadota bacterium]NNM04254.1 glycosyltransferase family 4 protein [Gemmatimonadota bacterium]